MDRLTITLPGGVMREARQRDPWEDSTRREIDPLGAEPTAGPVRLVAALNVWEDAAELRQHIGSWIEHVDRVVAIDGAYRGTQVAEPASRDDTHDVLREAAGRAGTELVWTPADVWRSQEQKRTLALRSHEHGDVVVIIDADEEWHGLAELRAQLADPDELAHDLDVGWVRYTSPVYERGQDTPRVIRWRPGLHYATRHHYLYDGGGELLATAQIGGTGRQHRIVPGVGFHNCRGRCSRPGARMDLAMRRRHEQVTAEARADRSRGVQGVNPLRVVQLSQIDPGAVVYRLHSALNATSPHSSVFGKLTSEVFATGGQYGYGSPELDVALRTADVVHVHRDPLEYVTLRHDPIKAGQAIVTHAHGTRARTRPRTFLRAPAHARLVSNLELFGALAEATGGELPGVHYLPNPVPCERYWRLAARTNPRRRAGSTALPLRVAHSPTRRAFKGTDAFLAVAAELPELVEPVLIEGRSHADALRIKARCDAVFDSFWLGMQCSGLEGAAMGLPVLAGDHSVAAEYRWWLGESSHLGPMGVPYTWADDRATLRAQLERLALDPEYRDAEARRVARFVREVHDYPAVVERYLDVLDEATRWRVRNASIFRINQRFRDPRG